MINGKSCTSGESTSVRAQRRCVPTTDSDANASHRSAVVDATLDVVAVVDEPALVAAVVTDDAAAASAATRRAKNEAPRDASTR